LPSVIEAVYLCKGEADFRQQSINVLFFSTPYHGTVATVELFLL